MNVWTHGVDLEAAMSSGLLHVLFFFRIHDFGEGAWAGDCTFVVI